MLLEFSFEYIRTKINIISKTNGFFVMFKSCLYDIFFLQDCSVLFFFFFALLFFVIFILIQNFILHIFKYFI